MPRNVTLCEMAPRDGMQVLNAACGIPLEDRLRLIELLMEAGFPYIEVGSFVHPKAVPAMSDTDQLVSRLKSHQGELAALVPNMKGYSSFRRSDILDTVALFVSASEHYSRVNTRMTITQALEAAGEVARAARQDGYRLRAHLSGAFRDLTPANKPSALETVYRVTEHLIEIGCRVVALADTDGKATPSDMARVLEGIAERFDGRRIGVHLHDRYGLGIANALLAYQLGVRTFDCSVGGIGGNPRAGKGAFGNIATEELLLLLRSQGADADIRSGPVLQAAKLVAAMSRRAGHPEPPSKVLRNEIAAP